MLEVLGVADAELVLDAAESIVDHDARAALLAVERLAASGRDATQFMRDLAAHLRHLFVVQTLGEVPDSFAVTAEHTDRLSGQADRLAQGEVLRAIDLLAAAMAAVKDGSEPRIQLELALLKAVQPEADSSLGALMFRIERLEERLAGLAGAASEPSPAASSPAAPASSGADGATRADPPRSERNAAGAGAPSGPTPTAAPSPPPAAPRPAPAVAAARRHRGSGRAGTPGRYARAGARRRACACRPRAGPRGRSGSRRRPGHRPALDLDRVKFLWPAALEEVATHNAMVAALLGEARPTAFEAGRLTVTFPPDHAFSRKKAESNRPLLQSALHGLTGHALQLSYELGDGPLDTGAPALAEEELLARLRDEFDARELLDDEPEGD